jgi:hypothetical protein
VRTLIGQLALALVLLTVRAATAQPARGTNQPDESTAPSASEFRLGFEERFRLETWDNIVDHSAAAADHRSQWRFRTRAWAALRLGDRLGFAVGLNNESKGQGDPRVPLTRDEAILETLWVDVRPVRRLSVRAGRQNLQRGDGFILFDGTPGDGSRTAYVNGLDASYAFTAKASLEVIALSNPGRDAYLPVLADTRRALVEWDERLAGLYYTDTRRPGLDVQAYAFYKTERNDPRSPAHPQFQPDRQLGTVGVRVARSFGAAWTLTGEFAGQRGVQVPDIPIRAWGGYLNVRHRLAARWAPTILAGCTALSGDAPGTRTIEQWDPVMSRWPKWSESYVYTLGPEVGTSYWTNIALWQAEVTMSPSKRTGLRATYYHLTALHPFAGSNPGFGSGNGRGDLVEARLDFTVRDALKGHVMYERLVPGTFYASRDPGYFFRVEMLVGLQHAWR